MRPNADNCMQMQEHEHAQEHEQEEVQNSDNVFSSLCVFPTTIGSAVRIGDNNKKLNKNPPSSHNQIRKPKTALNNNNNNGHLNNRKLKTIAKNMAAHGTTITPLNPMPMYKQIDNNNSCNRTVNRNSFLANLTDDMFVLESPSFVVPLLYTKAPKVSLRDFLAECEKSLKPEGGISSESEEETEHFDSKNPEKTFFSSSIGKFFIDIGLDCAKSYIRKDFEKILNGDPSTRLKFFGGEINDTTDLFNFPLKCCHLCNFKSESSIVMNEHMFGLHWDAKNVYRCTFCSFTTRKHMIIVMHLQSRHRVQPRIEVPVLQHLCPLCSYEDNVKSRYNRHVVACAKRYNITDFLTPPDEWIPPAKIGMVGKNGEYIPKSRISTVQRPNIPKVPNNNNFQKMNNNYKFPQLSQMPFIVCEICDGYLRNFNDYKTHLLLVHQVALMQTPKPPLDCTKCKHRFHTERGLLRHYLGYHGMITQEFLDAEKEGKDCGKCLLCHKIFNKNYLYHMRRDHKLALKIFCLSFRCILCAAQFNNYNSFSSHAYTAHGTPKN